MSNLSDNLRHVPSVDQLLRTEAAQALRDSVGARRATNIARSAIAEIRTLVRDGAVKPAGNGLLAEAIRRLEAAAERELQTGLKAVINATGVLLHTNLGRAPLSQSARTALDEAAGYCSLEYDLESGTRGGRGTRVESLLKDLTGAEDALVVNNCAAAALLILKVLAGDGETIVSRGELVEIGGDFRVPDVMASSGTRMVEVGTTNRTHLRDYQQAITSHTRLIMRVHPSNYRIVGFASSPDRAELAALAHEAKLPLYEDAGSGQLADLRKYGVSDEPVIRELIASGVDVVSFSGDKLLGSAQAGLIVGTHKIVSQLRKHPLYRALRSDKLRLAVLQATLISHQRDVANNEVPVIQMLSLTADEIEQRARSLVEGLDVEFVAGESALGGGAGPTAHLPTMLIALTHPKKSAAEIEQEFRRYSPPVIVRVADGRVLIDLRTVFDYQLPSLRDALTTISK